MSKTAAAIAVLMCAAVVASGCPSSNSARADEPVRLMGVVSAMDDVLETGHFMPGERISGATLKVDCPDEEPRVVAASEEYGRFVYRDDERISSACSIIAEHPDYISRTYAVSDARRTTLQVRLLPREYRP